ncbi:MAG: NAD(P)H-hydrate epimerase, partial [Lentisphaeria bacterium]|nr:NAD(P)H-hydrate epimerase [Lentisphaeria bacterium]
MRRLDAGTIRSGYRSGMELMSRAGQAVAEAVIAHFPGNDPVAILAGKGNNGGDGFIVADLLVKTGRPVRLFTAVSPRELRGDALTAFYRMTDSPLLERFCVCTPEALSGCGVIVDAMLGTGFSGVPRAPFAEWIAMVNHSGIPVIAVDIPSGVTADDGSVTG